MFIPAAMTISLTMTLDASLCNFFQFVVLFLLNLLGFLHIAL